MSAGGTTAPVADERALTAQHAAELASGERFGFGANWAAFLRVLDEARIGEAERSLQAFLKVARLDGRTFLDIGSGSGLFSLAARRLGARVVSFDFDPQSVACTRELRRRYFPEDAGWEVRQGSALDAGFVRGLGQFDVVYSWGVLHHTGDMWTGIRLAQEAVAPGGLFFIAIYNDQGAWSERWKKIKRFYCSGPVGKWLVLGTFVPWWLLRGFVADVVWGRNPLARYTGYRKGRGMSVVHDWKDWLGGYPFEVAKPEELLEPILGQGWSLVKLHTTRGDEGCIQVVFRRPA